MSIKHHITRVLPGPVMRRIKRMMYPGVVRRYSEADWPHADVVKALVPDGGVVLDVGANIGYLSKLFAGWVGASGTVHSFEPIPETFAYLKHNLERVGLPQVQVRNVALSDRKATRTMQIPTYPDGTPNFYESHIAAESAGDGITIQTETMDALDLAAVDFIKIDVEGHEWEVLQGGKALIESLRPPMLIEVQGNLADPEAPAGMLHAFLAGFGYRPFILREGRLIAWEDPYRAVDYLFLTEEQQARLTALTLLTV